MKHLCRYTDNATLGACYVGANEFLFRSVFEDSINFLN